MWCGAPDGKVLIHQLVSRKCFWDRYWGCAVQLLANFFPALETVPEVFARVNSAQFLSRVIKGHRYILTSLVTIGQSHTWRKKSNFALWNPENINCTIQTYCFGSLIWMVTPRDFIQGFKTKFYVSLTHPRVKLLKLQQMRYLLYKNTKRLLEDLEVYYDWNLGSVKQTSHYFLAIFSRHAKTSWKS